MDKGCSSRTRAASPHAPLFTIHKKDSNNLVFRDPRGMDCGPVQRVYVRLSHKYQERTTMIGSLSDASMDGSGGLCAISRVL